MSGVQLPCRECLTCPGRITFLGAETVTPHTLEREDVAPVDWLPLSRRELEVLRSIASGHSNKEIARALTISDQTVKNHITSILRKLNVPDRTSASVFALRKGWLGF